MIKIQTARPYGTYSSKKSIGFADFPNSVNAARQQIRTKILDLNFTDIRKDCDNQYVYFYEINKVNTKKKNTKKKQTSPQGNKVNKREIVQEGSVTVKLFRFRRENVASSKQHARHFEVVLKF